MNAYKIDGELSPLLVNMAVFHIAKHISEHDTPKEVSVESAYNAVEEIFKRSLSAYIDAIGMPWVCAVLAWNSANGEKRCGCQCCQMRMRMTNEPHL